MLTKDPPQHKHAHTPQMLLHIYTHSDLTHRQSHPHTHAHESDHHDTNVEGTRMVDSDDHYGRQITFSPWTHDPL